MHSDEKPLKLVVNRFRSRRSSSRESSLTPIESLQLSQTSIHPRTTTDQLSQTGLDPLSAPLLSLYESVLKRQISKKQFKKSASETVGFSDIWLNKQHHTSIEIISEDGDAFITLEVETINLGSEGRSEIPHSFVFERPQGEIVFTATTPDTAHLPVTVIKKEPHSRDIKICFTKFIEPLESTHYFLSFFVPRIFQHHFFYYIRPRTKTLSASLSVTSTGLYKIGTPRIVFESADGFTQDKSPIPNTIDFEDRKGFSWETTGIQAGDLIRTFWK